MSIEFKMRRVQSNYLGTYIRSRYYTRKITYRCITISDLCLNLVQEEEESKEECNTLHRITAAKRVSTEIWSVHRLLEDITAWKY